MAAPLFDTLRLSRSLRDKGHFSSEQAEALAEAFAEASQDTLTTKADLRETESRVSEATKTDLRETESRLEAKLEALGTDLRQTEARLDTKIEGVKASLRETELRLEAKLETFKFDILKWVIGTIGFQTMVIFGTALTLFRGIGR